MHIYFGSDISAIEDDTVEIYSLNGLNYYGDISESDPENEKQIGLIWYNKNEFNEYIGFSDGIYDDSYDEEAYLKEKDATIAYEKEFEKENAPTKTNGIVAAAFLTQIETKYKEAVGLMDSIISAAASM